MIAPAPFVSESVSQFFPYHNHSDRETPYWSARMAEQTYQNFEVIHVDGKSNDKTVERVNIFKESLDITTYFSEKRNVSAQRNQGIQEAKGKWIIFMDADNRLPSYFLDGIRYRLARKASTELFTTWVSIDKEKTLNQPIERAINFGLELGKIIGKEWSLGALLGVKRSIVTEDYWFDTKQKVGEDGFFVKKIVDSGRTFNIFKDPKYTFSVRRLDSEGTIKMARTGAMLGINYFSGKDFSKNDFGYKMEGGSAYAKQNQGSFYNLQTVIKSATTHQIEQAKNLFNKLTNQDL